jgi:hypothetical protein
MVIGRHNPVSKKVIKILTAPQGLICHRLLTSLCLAVVTGVQKMIMRAV